MPGPRRRSHLPELESTAALRPYMPRLQIQWLSEAPGTLLRELEGTVVFVDISGFTKMSERLARKGKVGAEEVTDVLGAVFARLLSVGYGEGGGLIKFGGDALLLFFSGPDHAIKGARAAHGMRAMLREIGPISSSAGKITLRMSVGVHSDMFHFFLVGDSHRELMITGPAATRTVEMESTAVAGEILVSEATAALLPERILGKPKGEGMLLRSAPQGLAKAWPEPEPALEGIDLLSCIPVAIRDHVLAGEAEPEHRQVTVAFVHFDGIDHLISREGAEAAAFGLDALVTQAQAASDKHGVTFLGTDIDTDGGKIILVSGTPSALGDDEERMLLTLRAIIDAETAIPVRIGVNRGHVFSGDIGPSYRRTYTVMGDAVNLAARVMSKAEPGQLLATGPVLEAAGIAFNEIALEPFMVKGKSRPVHAFIVGAPTGAKPTETLAELPLVGRETELAAFRQAIAGLNEGRGSLIEIVGDPGIGKTRLINELRRMAEGLPQLVAACDRYEASTPYLPIRRLFRLLIGSEAEDTIAARLRVHVETTAPEMLPWLPLLAVVADVEVPMTPEVAQLGEEFRKPKLEEVTTEFLSRVIKEPTLVALEDAHWMDEGSRDLLDHVARRIGELRWLVCVTRRDEETGFVAPRTEGCATLHPKPLSMDEAEGLIQAVTEDAPMMPHDAAAIAERAAGNPLFLQELLRAMQQVGSVEGLPDSVEGMVVAQVDRLPAADRRLLRYASVLGATFTDELVTGLLAEEAIAIDRDAWRRLADFVEEEGAGIRRFRHALMRDAAYEGLPFRRRRELHARIGEMIVRRAGEAPEEQAELLSLHFFNAQRYPEAWAYSGVAGRRAWEKFAPLAAAEFYERALQAARKLGELLPGDIAEIHERLAEAHWRVGRFADYGSEYRAARNLVRDDPVKVAGYLRLEAAAYDPEGRYAQSLRTLSRARKVLEGLEGRAADRERARISAECAAIFQRQGRHRPAIAACHIAIADGEKAGEPEAVAQAHGLLGFAYAELGRYAESAEQNRLALAHYEGSEDLGGQSMVLNNWGLTAQYEGDWATAVDRYTRAREIRARMGDPSFVALTTNNIGEIYSDQGRFEEAEACFREAIRVWRAVGDEAFAAMALGNQGRLLYRTGRADEAITVLKEVGDAFRNLGIRSFLIETEARLAEALLFAGRGPEALEMASGALQGPEGKEVLQAPTLFRAIGYAHLQMGDPWMAREAFDESLVIARRMGMRFEIALGARAMGDIARAVGEAPDPGLEEESRSILEQLEVLAIPEVPLRSGTSGIRS